MTKHIIIIPTYNEIKNIEAMVQTISNLPQKFDICFVDDNSPDNTSIEIKKHQKAITSYTIHLIHRTTKKGLGSAYIEGFTFAINHNYDYIYQMDCDFSHNPNELITFRLLLDQGNDFVIGSRYINDGSTYNWSLGRILISRLASFYVKFTTGLPVNDPTSGFSGILASIIKKIINTSQINKFHGYAFQVALKFLAFSFGATLKESPICFEERRLGQSKFNSSILIEAVLKVPLLRFINLKK